MKWKTNGKRFLALLLTAVLLLSVCPVTASAEETDGLCPHHTEHDENCGYVQGSPCTHEHVGTCYEWEKNCTHQHVATCYEWVKNCTHKHVATCYSDGVRPTEGEEKQADACTHQCSEETDCLIRGEKICTHECSEETRCLIRGEEDCKHVHMATECGYVEGHDCEYQCDICSVPAATMKVQETKDVKASNSYVLLHPSTGTTPTGVKVSVGGTINGYTITSINGYDIKVDLGTYNVHLNSFRIPLPEEIWKGVAMQYNPQTYVIAGTSGAVQKTPGANALLGNGGNTFYYYNLGPAGGGTSNLWNFTLQYDANGGSGAPQAQTWGTSDKFTKSHTFTVSSTTPTREGYVFKGWSDSKDGTVKYSPNGSCMVSQKVDGFNGGSVTKTIYAVWEEVAKTPTYAGDSTMNITKKFVGIDSAPDGFQLNYSYTDLATNQGVTGTVTLTGTGDTLTGSLSLPYYNNVATGETYALTITEQNADVTGYTMNISANSANNINQQAHSFQYAISATTKSTLNRTITNTYTKNQPSTDWSGLTIEKKAASTSDTVKPGDTITYTITVKNGTGKDLKNITVSEKLDTSLTFVKASPEGQYDSEDGIWTIPSITNGSTATLTIEATVKDGVADGTEIKNNAAITGAEDSDGGKPGEDEELDDAEANVTVTIPQEIPALTVTKTADKTEVAPGETVTYTIRVKNNTSETISGIVLKDTLPEGASIESALGAASTTAYNVITFEAFDLAANEEKTFTLAVKYADVTASVTKTNTATATSGDKDYTDKADVTVKPADTPTAPDWGKLKITKTADKTEVKPGDTVVYTITVENQTGKNLNDVIISEKLDTNLIFVSATPGDLYNSTDNAWTIPILENDTTATLTITATVSEKASGKIPNTVTVTGAKTEDGDALPEDDQPTASVDITVKPDEPVKPDWDKLTISKSANPKAVKRGETITYTILVQNKTGVNLDTVTVQENPDSNLTVTGHSQGAAYDAEKNVWTITGLANGAEAKLTVTATVNADTTASVVWNTVSITSASAGGGETLTGKPSDSISVVVTDPKPTAPEPETDWDGLTLKKTANRSSVRPGKTITYTLTVTNKTGKDLTDIAVSEKLDANLTFVSSSGDGKYDVKTGEWTIGKLENGGKATLTLKATVKTGLKDGTVIKNTACITDAGAENGDTLPTDAQPSGSANVTVSNKISVIPQTGDTSSIGLWIGVMVACAVVLGVVLIFTVKKKKTR